MNYLLSKEHFIAHDQLLNDYKNLICHYEDWKMFKSKSARNNCHKYLISILVNKDILKIDTSADELLLDELFDR